MAGEWRETTLGQVADFLSGGTPSKDNPSYWNGAIPWVSAKDMKRFRLDDTEDHVTKDGVANGTKLVPSGTVFLLARGMTLLNDLPICVANCAMTFNQDVKALRPNPLADLFPDSFEDSELEEIPKGWGIGKLGDVAIHPRRGVQPSEIDPTIPYIALEHMPKRCIALSDWGIADRLESNKFEFTRGEILFGKLRPYFHKVGVAPVDGVCSTDIVVVTPRIDKWFGFVLGHVSSDAFVEHTNAGSTGTKMPRTSWGDMARYAVVLPPAPIAEALTEQIRPAVDCILASIQESRTLAALRDTLLPKLISGESRVPDAERIIGMAGLPSDAKGSGGSDGLDRPDATVERLKRRGRCLGKAG